MRTASQAQKGAPRSFTTSPWLPASCRPHRPLVRQGPQEDYGKTTIRKRRLLFACEAMLRLKKQGAIPQSNDVCTDSWYERKPGPGGPLSNWLRTLRLPRRRSIHRRLYGKLPAAEWSWNSIVDPCSKGGQVVPGVLEAAERFMARWHEEEKKFSKRRAARIHGAQSRTGGGTNRETTVD